MQTTASTCLRSTTGVLVCTWLRVRLRGRAPRGAHNRCPPSRRAELAWRAGKEQRLWQEQRAPPPQRASPTAELSLLHHRCPSLLPGDQPTSGCPRDRLARVLPSPQAACAGAAVSQPQHSLSGGLRRLRALGGGQRAQGLQGPTSPGCKAAHVACLGHQGPGPHGTWWPSIELLPKPAQGTVSPAQLWTQEGSVPQFLPGALSPAPEEVCK